VNGQEPFVKVLKDGFFEVGCYNDGMLEHSDKFGGNKDKYGSSAQMVNVSIAKYRELVLDSEEEAMTPRVCYEFCRTLPGMVFFGISNGNECYCEPYFKPQAGGSSSCDVPCEGEKTSMCGGKVKSTVWEMHLCADTAEDLAENTLAAEEALTFFYESAGLAADLGEKMTEAGEALEDVAGLSGSPMTGDLGMSAKVEAGKLSKSFMAGRKDYETLLVAGNKAVELEGGDFTDAKTLTEVEDTVLTIQKTEPVVHKFAAGVHDLVKAVFPASSYQTFGATPENDKLTKELANPQAEATDFKLASYAMGEQSLAPQGLSCSGEVIGLPMLGLGVSGCGLACEQTLYPNKCVAFAHYQVDGKEDLCFLFSDVRDVETFEEPASAALVQKRLLKADKDTKASATCKVKMSEIASGFKPKGALKKNKRCFGACGSFSARETVQDYQVPSSVTVNGQEVITQFVAA